MEGRPSKPTILKILNGIERKDRINQNEPKPELVLIPCPEYIRNDTIAYNEWNRIVPELYKLGLLTNIDRATLELYCTQYSIYRRSYETINEEGLVTTNISNGDKAHPSTQIAREAAKIIKAIAVEFGLTPSSRSRISLPKESDEDLIDKMCTKN